MSGVLLMGSSACADKAFLLGQSTSAVGDTRVAGDTEGGNVPHEGHEKTTQDFFDLGTIHYSEGEYDKARKAFKEAARRDPDNAEAHYRLGLAYRELNEMDYALRAFEQSIRINPDYTEAHYDLGMAYKKFNRYDAALNSFRAAVRLDPGSADAQYYLGDTYLDAGLKKEALAAFLKAVEIKPDHAEAHYGLGRIYVMFSDIGAALREYKILLSLDHRLAYDLFNQIYE
jgi:tetratricopeptide (TPR) repeat protein